MAGTEAQAFGALLRQLRLAASLTQEALAERAGLSVRGLRHLEDGTRHPYPDTLSQLVAALGLSGAARERLLAVARNRQARVVPSVAFPWPAPIQDEPSLLVGRVEELSLLDRHLAGRGAPVLLLAGEPGIGKTRLLLEAARRATPLGWTVLAGGCTRAGQEPYAPLAEALERYLAALVPSAAQAVLADCAWLSRLLPDLPADALESLPTAYLGHLQERQLLFKAVRRCLANVAGTTGTLLLLDDLQWAGADALALLAHLLQQSTSAPLRVVGAYRDTEVGPEHPLSSLLAELAERQLGAQRRLGPLIWQEAQQLLGSLLGERGGAAWQAQMARRAGGVPFFLVSCARSLQQEAGAEPTAEELPWDVRQSIRRRVQALPEVGRQLLAVAAVVGRVSPHRLLLAVLQQPEGAMLDALDGACRQGLLQEVGDDSYGFVHDLIHEVVEGDLGLARRRLLHRQVAEALEGQGGQAPVEALAYHYSQAGEQAKAAAYLEQAGDQAADRFATAAAAEHYRLLMACLEGLDRPADLARASEKLGWQLHLVGQLDAALAALERAAASARMAGDLDSLARVEAHIANGHWWRGTIAAGLARLQPAAATLEARGPSSGLTGVYGEMAFLLHHDGRYEEALAAAERAVAMARLLGDSGTLGWRQYYQVRCLFMLSRIDEAFQALEDTVRMAEELDDRFLLCWCLLDRAWIHEERGQYEEERRDAGRVLALAPAEPTTLPAVLLLANSRLGASAFFTGDWPQARDWLKKNIALLAWCPPEGQAVAIPHLDCGRLCLAEGDWEEAARHLEAGLAAFPESGEMSLVRKAQGLLAERDVLAGDPAAARARLLPLLGRPGREEWDVTQYLLPVLAWAQLELGQTEQAAATAGTAVQRAREGPCRLGLVTALRVQALVFLAWGPLTEAAHALDEGLAVARAMPYPHGEGRLLEVYARLHRARGDAGTARERLEAALVIFHRLGAVKDEVRVQQLLVTLG